LIESNEYQTSTINVNGDCDPEIKACRIRAALGSLNEERIKAAEEAA